MGNVKGLQDPYRNPTTQQGWAERWGQNAAMVTSFADGSKISFEQSIVANATGFKVRSRGMSRGLKYDGSIMEIQKLYDIDELRALGGIVDYTVGPPLIKVFCLAEHPDPKQRHYLNLYKMGEGPLYPFWIPYHLVHFEAPNAIARVVLFGDELAPPLGGPVVEVCAVAKRDLKAGEVLDEYGMYMTYGEAMNAAEMSAGRCLPEGLVEGCRLRRDVPKDQVLTYADVELPEGRLADQLRAEQYRHFRGETWLEDLLAGVPRAPLATDGRRAHRRAFRDTLGRETALLHESSDLLRRPGHAAPRVLGVDPQAHGAGRLPADPLARHALLRALRAQGLHPLPRLPGRHASRSTSSSTTRPSPTTSC